MIRRSLFYIPILVLFSLSGWTQDTLSIISPKPDQSLFGKSSVVISWTTDLGEGFLYSISFSSDGQIFDTPVAHKLTETTYEWPVTAPIGSEGWIKVKMMDYNGVLLADKTVKINWMPQQAIIVSKANQRVYRFKNNKLQYLFKCSTALPEFDGTEGEYSVISKEIKHWSKKYELWMPYSLFYYQGYAIHATTQIRRLGSVASHGCVRLHPRDAKRLFEDTKVGEKVIVLPPDIRTDYLDQHQSELSQSPKNKSAASKKPAAVSLTPGNSL